MTKQVKFLTIISILLLSTSFAMFANDISETVQEEQQTKPQDTTNFKSNYDEYSMAEKNFASKYHVNPRNITDVWFKHKSFVRTGIALAVSGGLMYAVGMPSLVGPGVALCFFGPLLFVGIAMCVFGGLVALAGVVVQAFCSVPFSKAGTLAVRYKKLYNIKLKDAAIEANVASMHDSENREAGMAIAFGIK